MSFQAQRELLEIGDTIDTITMVGNIRKSKPVVVMDVMRGAARYKFPDGRLSVIGFKDLDFQTIVKKKPRVERAAAPQPKPEPVAVKLPIKEPMVLLSPAVIESMESKPKKNDALAELDAWLEMGRDLENSVAVLEAQQRQNIKDLTTDKETIERAIEAAQLEWRGTQAKLEMIRKIGRGQQP